MVSTREDASVACIMVAIIDCMSQSKKFTHICSVFRNSERFLVVLVGTFRVCWFLHFSAQTVRVGLNVREFTQQNQDLLGQNPAETGPAGAEPSRTLTRWGRTFPAFTGLLFLNLLTFLSDSSSSGPRCWWMVLDN